MFQQKKNDSECRRCVILVGHAVHNDIEMMKKHFGVDLERDGSIVARLDTQVMAEEAGYATPGRPISLSNLLRTFHIEELYLHNAGNDIMYTMIAAFLTSLEGLRKSKRILDRAEAMQGIAAKIETIKKWRSVYDLEPSLGDELFCTKCHSTDHESGDCNVTGLFCDSCQENGHTSAKCVRGATRSPANFVQLPCEACVVNPDPRIWRTADYHLSADCTRNVQYITLRLSIAYQVLTRNQVR
jgi:hypothetical protein